MAVDNLEVEAASRAAEVLQAALDEVKNAQNSQGSATNELLLAGLKVADQLVEAAKRPGAVNSEAGNIKEGSGDSAARDNNKRADPQLLESLENFARMTENLADRLEEMLTSEKGQSEAAL